MFPSTMTMALGLAIATASLWIDWYVWRLAPVLPHPLAASRPRNADDERSRSKRLLKGYADPIDPDSRREIRSRVPNYTPAASKNMY